MSILEPGANGTSLVVCTTCKLAKDQPVDSQGRRGGEVFVETLQQELTRLDLAGEITLEPMACLFACSSHCTVHLRAPGKIGYVLGTFEPTQDAAAALVEYARQYSLSDEGVVPYRQWPEGVKGHFIVRIPPSGMIVSD